MIYPIKIPKILTGPQEKLKDQKNHPVWHLDQDILNYNLEKGDNQQQKKKKYKKQRKHVT